MYILLLLSWLLSQLTVCLVCYILVCGSLAEHLGSNQNTRVQIQSALYIITYLKYCRYVRVLIKNNIVDCTARSRLPKRHLDFVLL